MNAIETSGLTKKYKNKTAVDNLTFSVEQGTLFALLGINGAGKTTTLKMLSCLTMPNSGSAMVAGCSILDNPQGVKAKINVSPQETAVAPNLTVGENLVLIAGIFGLSPAEAKKKAAEMMSAFGLTPEAKSKAKTLSGGTQRRLSIAMALISRPEILFLDEPTLGLDVLARRELWKAIEKLKGKVTVILTTHYMEEAEALSDTIGVMSKGRLAAVGTAEELIARTHTSSFEDAFIALAGEEEAEV